MPIWKTLDTVFLKQPSDPIKAFLEMINISTISDLKKMISTKNDGTKYTHDLFDYFWIPLNEIFFFCFGMVLLFFGLKYKFRIDFIIFIVVIILFLTKIVLYYAVLKKRDVYTTLYYYIFDYGNLMLKPLFNLNYFLSLHIISCNFFYEM
jgi:hypothetical protein